MFKVIFKILFQKLGFFTLSHLIISQHGTALHTAVALNCLDALEALLLHPASRHLIDRYCKRK